MLKLDLQRAPAGIAGDVSEHGQALDILAAVVREQPCVRTRAILPVHGVEHQVARVNVVVLDPVCGGNSRVGILAGAGDRG